MGGLGYAAKLGGFRVREAGLNLAYFAQAAIVGHWMRRHQLAYLNTHYSSTVALLVHKPSDLRSRPRSTGSARSSNPRM
jgi:hypothetical protein